MRSDSARAQALANSVAFWHVSCFSYQARFWKMNSLIIAFIACTLAYGLMWHNKTPRSEGEEDDRFAKSEKPEKKNEKERN